MRARTSRTRQLQMVRECHHPAEQHIELLELSARGDISYVDGLSGIEIAKRESNPRLYHLE